MGLKFGGETSNLLNMQLITQMLLIFASSLSNLQRTDATLNSVLNIERDFPYLIDNKTGSIIQPRDYMDFDSIYAPNSTYKRKQTAQMRNYNLLKAFDFANYFQSDYWRYSSEQDLLESALPVASEELCNLQLDWLESQLNRSKPISVLALPGEQHVQLARLMDSFGRPEAGSQLGQNLWLGSYYECLITKLNTSDFEREECNSELMSCSLGAARRILHPHGEVFKTRYCISKWRSKEWPSETEDAYRPVISYKLGVCLPETCESLTIRRRKQQLERIMRHQMDLMTASSLYLNDLYCAPDERSPLRKLSFASWTFLSLCGAWLVALLIATLILELNFSNSNDDSTKPAKQPPREGDKGSALKLSICKALSISESVRELYRLPPMLKDQNKDQLRINLNAMDAIKCLCCVLVILGHTVFIHMQHSPNILKTIEMSYMRYPRILIAFFNFVDTFFIISGMLTAYFVFKRFNKQTLSNPLVWFQVSLLRFLRLMPVYFLTFWFTKTISIHLSEGPIWDYATDMSSIKGLCVNDHWWKSIVYLGNLGTIQPLCILPAWSIIVDSQYSLVLPPIVYLLMRNRKLAYLTFLVATLASTAHMSYQLATQTSVKQSDMAKVRLHVYPMISRFAAEFYNTAWNRIGPVAIGLIGGHSLFLYESGKLLRWPRFMRGLSFKLILFAHSFIFLLPAFSGSSEPNNLQNEVKQSTESSTDLILFVISNAAVKPIWSIINTILLLRLVTDLRFGSKLVNLMSQNCWHSLGKLCFTAYLIHYEILILLLKSRSEGLIEPNCLNILREFGAALIATVLLSYLIYILYESPVNRLVSLAIQSQKQKLEAGSMRLSNGHTYIGQTELHAPTGNSNSNATQDLP